jgi:tetratricopeptide (TPR) repeat protein
VLHYHGELSKALAHEERAIALYDEGALGTLEPAYGLDPGIVALCFASFTLMQLGHPDRSAERIEQAIAQTRARAQHYSLAYALNWAAIADYLRGDLRRMIERNEEAIEVSTERGFVQQLFGASRLRASALAILGDAEAAGADLEGWARASIGPVGGPFVGAAADGLRRLQRLDDALRWVDTWLAVAAEIHAPYWDAECLRLKGEIRLAQDPAATHEAESLFRRAISIAQEQEGRWLELRAADRLARLLRDQERRDEARALLQPVYDGFTEGFDTQDLKDAKALLEELSA